MGRGGHYFATCIGGEVPPCRGSRFNQDFWAGAAFPWSKGSVLKSENLAAITEKATLSRGLGRSYGDSSLPARPDLPVADTTLANRLLCFDPASGLLRAEAGVSLLELNRVFLRRGWFVPVSPGTQFVTLGGMVASDVHGKNHHVDGCFGQHVASVKLRVADGRIVECSETAEPELFRATIGGMGLTGHILEVEFPMRSIPSPWIWGESERIDDLDAMVAGLKEAAREWPMTVGWVDCLARGARLGRGILMKGRWAASRDRGSRRNRRRRKRRFRVPFQFPQNRPVQGEHEGVQSGLLLEAHSTGSPRHRPSRRLLLSAGCLGRLEPDLRPPRIHAVPMRVAARRRQRPGPAFPGSCSFPPAGWDFCASSRIAGAEGKGMLSFPRPGMSIAMDFPIHPTEDAGVGRPAERIGDCRRRADLPDEGHVHPAGAFSRDGAAAGGVQRRAPPLGPGGPHPQRPIGATLGRPRMKAVLLGATQGMGRALARLMAARGDRLFLLEHVPEELERSARDLEIYGAPKPVGTAYCDLLQPATFAPALDQAQRELGGFDTVVVTAGLFAPQEELENDPELAARLLAADFTNTVLFCEEARKRLLGRRHAVRVQFRGRRAGPEAGDPVRRGEGRAVAIPGRLGPQVSRPRTEDDLREAGLREDRHDGGPEAAAFRRHAGGGCPAGAEGDRPRLARGLRARAVALGDVRDPRLPRWVMRRIGF